MKVSIPKWLNDLRFGVGPLSGNIYAGRLLKRGVHVEWQNKRDVTHEVLGIVAEYALRAEQRGSQIEITKDGKPYAIITVERAP